MKCSWSVTGLVGTWMGNHLQVAALTSNVTSHLAQLNLASK